MIKLFEKKSCPNCRKKVKDEFSFCPYCGEELEEESDSTVMSFGEMFEDVDKEFERIDKMFGFGPFKVKMFKLPKTRSDGISIVIHSDTGMRPKVEVKTSGGYKKLEPELKRKLGVKPGGEEIEEVEKEENSKRVPRTTEEPETKIENVGNKQRIQIKLPDVKNENNIEVKKLEQSMEIKAFAGNKAYFKLLPIIGNVIRKEFKNGILKIEIEKSISR